MGLMPGIILERPLRTEYIAYFHCGPLQKLFADKRLNKRKVTLNPVVLMPEGGGADLFWIQT